MNLWELRVNDTAFIDDVQSALGARFSETVENLGLKKNSLIKCLHKTILGGPRVYEVDGIVCTLCKEGASKIQIHK